MFLWFKAEVCVTRCYVTCLSKILKNDQEKIWVELFSRKCAGVQAPTLLKKGLLYKYFSWIYPSLQDSFPVRKLWKTVFINVHTWIYFIEYGNRFGNPLTNSYMTRTFLSNRLKIFLVFRTIFHEEICVQAVSHCEKINFSSRFL